MCSVKNLFLIETIIITYELILVFMKEETTNVLSLLTGDHFRLNQPDEKKYFLFIGNDKKDEILFAIIFIFLQPFSENWGEIGQKSFL